MDKNFDGSVSGYLDPEERAWETIVYQSSKPILDVEQNLLQDANFEAALRRVSVPSGWLKGDFLGGNIDFEYSSSTANEFKLVNKPVALVNGWKVVVEYTGTDTAKENILSLSAPPATGWRTDFVFLEVWRALLSASPDTTNKSAGGRVYRHGNVGIDPAHDATLNFTDDILQTPPGAETSKRVQIQYRIRVVDGINISSFPMGMNDPNVEAQGTQGSPVGTYTFTNMGATAGDYGLWRAGAGDTASQTALGTVDGYSYAIPIAAVFRRNTTAFSQSTNHNGGVLISAGTSDRPDDLFSDEISNGDVLDMRQGTSLVGWDLDEILETSFSALLDNTLSQVEQNTNSVPGYTYGMVGTTVLHADEIGPAGTGGLGGMNIGEQDAVRRRFSDRAIVEHPIVIKTPTGATWVSDEVVTINLGNFNPYPFDEGSGFDLASMSPANTVITDIRSAYFDHPNTTTGKVKAFFSEIKGIGSNIVTLTLADGVWTGNSPDLWLEVEISYPPGNGLTATPSNDFGDTWNSGAGGPFTLEDDPAGSRPADFNDFVNLEVVKNNREVQVLYETTDKTLDVYAKDVNTIVLPDRVGSVTSVTEDPLGTPVGHSFTFTANDPDREISTSVDPLSDPDALVRVVYKALRPIPNTVGYYQTVFYQSRALQPVKDSMLPNSLLYRTLYVSPYIYALTGGTGSFGATYPYEVPHVHIPVYINGAAPYVFNGEHELDSPLDTFTDDFDAASGFLRVSQNIPLVPMASAELQRTAVTDVDPEQRAFYPEVPTSEYRPAAFGKNLSFPQRHKVFFPIIAELLDDYDFGNKGTLVMIVFIRWAENDNENNVRFVDTPADDTSCAAVYRLKGNLLLNRRSV